MLLFLGFNTSARYATIIEKKKCNFYFSKVFARIEKILNIEERLGTW